MKFEKGDIVKLVTQDSNHYLTIDKEYEVIQGNDKDGDIIVCDDESDNDYYPAILFALAGDNSINLAKSLVGTTVNLLIDGVSTKTPIHAFSVWNKFYDVSGDKTITELIKRDGYAVTIEDKDGNSHTLSEIVKPLSNTIKLSDDYNAVIEGDNVVVGCQTIPINTVKEILERHAAINK